MGPSFARQRRLDKWRLDKWRLDKWRMRKRLRRVAKNHIPGGVRATRPGGIRTSHGGFATVPRRAGCDLGALPGDLLTRRETVLWIQERSFDPRGSCAP